MLARKTDAFASRQGFGGAVRFALDLVQTPFVMVRSSPSACSLPAACLLEHVTEHVVCCIWPSVACHMVYVALAYRVAP